MKRRKDNEKNERDKIIEQAKLVLAQPVFLASPARCNKNDNKTKQASLRIFTTFSGRNSKHITMKTIQTVIRTGTNIYLLIDT